MSTPERIPPEVTSGRHFDAWWKKASRATPDLLTFSSEMLIAAGLSPDPDALADPAVALKSLLKTARAA